MKDKSNIAIIGSGVVGSATGKTFTKIGNPVLFFDTDSSVISTLRSDGYEAYNMNVLSKYQKNIDCFFICVSTPTLESYIDTSIVINSIESIIKGLIKRDKKSGPAILVIRSTVPVGTHEICTQKMREIRPDLILNTDFALCSNPEYLREHNSLEDAQNPRAIVIGSSNESVANCIAKIYRSLDANIYIMTPKEAEMHKYIHNLFNACKISFFNEMRIACAESEINTEIIFPLVAHTAEANWNPQYGTHDRGAFGGACLPKDTSGFLLWARNHDIDMPLLEATIAVNEKFNKDNL